MFVAIRDLRFATGRFALMGAVVTLLTLLVVLLSGLTAGLGRGNTSAITDLPADQLVFATRRARRASQRDDAVGRNAFALTGIKREHRAAVIDIARATRAARLLRRNLGRR